MPDQIEIEVFKNGVFDLLDETFDEVHGYYLDSGNSLFPTLAEVSAAEASIPVGGRCASLAAQVQHVIVYLDMNERLMRTGKENPVDWEEAWRATEKVLPDEWQDLQQALRASYTRMKGAIQATDDWSDPYAVGNVIGIVAHTAYHLGEIRQALCTLKA